MANEYIRNEHITRKEHPDEPHGIEHILHPIVQKWFYSRFQEFSLPQRFGVLEIHSRKNVLVSAPTGATKTLTAFLSILNTLIDNQQRGVLEDKVYCVYVSPLRALSEDIRVNLIEPLRGMEEIAGKKFGIRVATRTGDTSARERELMRRNAPHILITTPESLAIMLCSQKFKEHLRDVEWCVIDEIHALAESKRGVHLSLSLERLQHVAGHMCRVGLSATVAPLEEVAQFLVGPQRPCLIVDVQFLKQLDLQVVSPLRDLISARHEQVRSALYDLIDRYVQEHKTTLIFTNTRSATERLVHALKERFPSRYMQNIGAHHGSLSKGVRHGIEERLRKGELKVVVCSTSLELGIDIGFIDLVLCIGSPKSVARALQRIGRSGHRLHDTTKGRIIVLDRDDLVECAVLLKSAVEKRIDRLHIPKGALDVLAQQVHGMAVERVWNEREMYDLIRRSYCFENLTRKDFDELLAYLSGEFTSLEDRSIYAKVWRKDGMVGRRGKMGRVIHMTNVGTIPDTTGVVVKVGDQVVGTIDEAFLEKLRPGDVFVLGGDVYEFRFSRGMVAVVSASAGRPPTVPSWVSEMLPLSFDLAVEIGKFRRLLLEHITAGKSKAVTIAFIHEYLYVDENAAEAIYVYAMEQWEFAGFIPNDRLIVLEEIHDEKGMRRIIFHSMFGRRVNDCLSRAVAFAIARSQHRDVDISMNDNGFVVSSSKGVDVSRALELLKASRFEEVMSAAIEDSEVLRRRFRHCAARSLMILRNYGGRAKRVGRQHVSSTILLNAVRRISKDFFILREARREVLEDLMDMAHAQEVLKGIEQKKIVMKKVSGDLPSPFALNLALMGVMDVLRIEDRVEFLRRMHENIVAKIALRNRRPLDHEVVQSDFDYEEVWRRHEVQAQKEKEERLTLLLDQLYRTVTRLKVSDRVAAALSGVLRGETEIAPHVRSELHARIPEMKKRWPKDLRDVILKRLHEIDVVLDEGAVEEVLEKQGSEKSGSAQSKEQEE